MKKILLWFKPISAYAILSKGGIVYYKQLFGQYYEVGNSFDSKITLNL